MQKIFIIKDSNFKQIAKEKGIIDFYLIDETGEERTVSAMTKLGRNKKIKNISAVFQREKPLVDVLAKASVKDRIVVDFTGFNNTHPRKVINKTVKPSSTIIKTATKSQDAIVLNESQRLAIVGVSVVALLILVKIFI